MLIDPTLVNGSPVDARVESCKRPVPPMLYAASPLDSRVAPYIDGLHPIVWLIGGCENWYGVALVTTCGHAVPGPETSNVSSRPPSRGDVSHRSVGMPVIN